MNDNSILFQTKLSNQEIYWQYSFISNNQTILNIDNRILFVTVESLVSLKIWSGFQLSNYRSHWHLGFVLGCQIVDIRDYRVVCMSNNWFVIDYGLLFWTVKPLGFFHSQWCFDGTIRHLSNKLRWRIYLSYLLTKLLSSELCYCFCLQPIKSDVTIKVYMDIELKIYIHHRNKLDLEGKGKCGRQPEMTNNENKLIVSQEIQIICFNLKWVMYQPLYRWLEIRILFWRST